MFFFSLRFVRLGFATQLSSLLLRFDLLGSRNSLLRTFAGARVGMRPLASHGQTAAVSDALITVDLYLAFDVLRDLPPEVSFDLVVRIDPLAQAHDLVVREISHARRRIDPRRRHGLMCERRPNPEYVGQRYL